MSKLIWNCLLGAALLSAAPGPKILIVTDLEGVGGVHNWEEQTAPGQRRFEESRRLLAAEVNAAITGAVEAGAAEVVVWDGHDGSRTLSVEDLDPPGRLLQGPRTPPDFYFSEDRYDGVFIVGQHSMAGTRKGLLAHTQSLSVERVTINGREVGEMGQIAAIAGHFGVPVLLLTGDQAACDEFLALQPKGEVVAVKRWAGKGAALSLPHSEARRLIRLHARRAVARIQEIPAWKIAGPVEMRFDYHPKKAEGGESKPVPSRTYKGATVLEAFEQWIPRDR